MDKETGYRTRSMLCVPMVDSGGVIIGVLQAINKNPMFPRFDTQDETLLRTFAAQAALAVRNAQLLTQTVTSLKQSDALLEVTKALSQELKVSREEKEEEERNHTRAGGPSGGVEQSHFFPIRPLRLSTWRRDALGGLTRLILSFLSCLLSLCARINQIEALIQIICGKVQALLHSERCTVFILDREKRELYTSEHMSFGMGPALPIDGERASFISFPMDRGIAGSVATTLEPVNIPDAYKDSRFNKVRRCGCSATNHGHVPRQQGGTRARVAP